MPSQSLWSMPLPLSLTSIDSTPASRNVMSARKGRGRVSTCIRPLRSETHAPTDVAPASSAFSTSSLTACGGGGEGQLDSHRRGSGEVDAPAVCKSTTTWPLVRRWTEVRSMAARCWSSRRRDGVRERQGAGEGWRWQGRTLNRHGSPSELVGLALVRCERGEVDGGGARGGAGAGRAPALPALARSRAAFRSEAHELQCTSFHDAQVYKTRRESEQNPSSGSSRPLPRPAGAAEPAWPHTPALSPTAHPRKGRRT